MKRTIVEDFRRHFGRNAQYLVLSPGRVNLIGEHIDYHKGRVLPCAISLKNYIAGALKKDYVVEGYNIDSQRRYTVDIQNPAPYERGSTELYIYGACRAIIDSGYFIKGFYFIIGGNLPLGSGLSSSASFCCGLVELISQIYHLNIHPKDIATIARVAENKYAYVPCGIMDQMSIVFGRERRLVRIDCRSLEIDYCPMPDVLSMVIVDTMIKRQLARSEYEKRQVECAELLDILKKRYENIDSLRDVSQEMLYSVEGAVSERSLARGKYVVEEMKRVDMAFEAMCRNDIERIRILFYEGHKGLRDEYEVSCEELDVIVEETYRFDGAIASRMTGAGFGGCVISLIKRGFEDEYISYIQEKYMSRFGKMCEVYNIGVPSEGLSSIRL